MPSRRSNSSLFARPIELPQEAVVWGADPQHDFRTDAAAADAMKSIERELERIVTGLLRKVEGNG